MSLFRGPNWTPCPPSPNTHTHTHTPHDNAVTEKGPLAQLSCLEGHSHMVAQWHIEDTQIATLTLAEVLHWLDQTPGVDSGVVGRHVGVSHPGYRHSFHSQTQAWAPGLGQRSQARRRQYKIWHKHGLLVSGKDLRLGEDNTRYDLNLQILVTNANSVAMAMSFSIGCYAGINAWVREEIWETANCEAVGCHQCILSMYECVTVEVSQVFGR